LVEKVLAQVINPQITAIAIIAMMKNNNVEKHQGRRFPAASITQAFSIRRLCLSGSLAESIQLIKSLRSTGVRSLH
jgi:hypothetical protein